VGPGIGHGSFGKDAFEGRAHKENPNDDCGGLQERYPNDHAIPPATRVAGPGKGQNRTLSFRTNDGT